MPHARPVPISPPPGVVKGEAQRVIEGRWSDAQWMRFKGGKPEKRGGHVKQTSSTTSGVPRAMHAWRDLSQQDFIGVGTAFKLYCYDSAFTRNDITPIERTGTLGNNPFATTDGSAIVTVTHAGHTRLSGSSVTFAGASAGSGLTLNGTYTVLVVTGATTYTINAGSNANATSAGIGGAAVTFSYEINVGAEAGTYALGYGVGGYGLATYGSARATSTLVLEPRIWSLQNYGKVLYATYNTGTIYTFDPATLSTNGRALALSGAPTDVRAMFITEERFVFALCENMTVRWPDQDDPTNWNASVADTANARRLTDGFKLIAGMALAQRISLVWSDSALYVFQYTGSSSVYDSRKVATNCGLLAPQAKATDSNGIVYWMSPHSFHLYNGAVQQIPNTGDILDFVFNALRADQPYLCWAYFDPKFNEVNFFYVATDTLIPELSVAYSIENQCWTPNDWSAWARASGTKFKNGETRPYLGGIDGNIYLQESGYNADGAAISAYIQLSPLEVADGAGNVQIDGLRVDLKDQVGDVTLAMSAYDTLRGGVIDTDEQTVTTSDELIDLRLAGRLADMQLTSNTVNGFFRLGKPIALIKDGGKRR